MHFLVFLPNSTQQTLETDCKLAGLTDLRGGEDVMPAVNGPDGLTGIMLGWTGPTNPHMHYDPAKQEWLPSIVKDDAGKPRYYVGIWKDSPPKESELRRNYTQSGVRVQFGDEKWKLPKPDTVDARAVYADDGSMRWETVRQFAWVCDEADALRDEYLQDFGIKAMVFRVDPKTQVEWLLRLLRINYRLTPELAAHLGLWVGRDHILDVVLETLGMCRKQESDQ